MFMTDTYKVLRESDTADAFDSKDVEEVAGEMNDVLSDIPYSDEQGVDNGGIPDATLEAAAIPLTKITANGRTKYVLEFSMLRLYMEENEMDPEDAGTAVEDIADANSGSEDPDTGETTDVETKDIIVVGPTDFEAKVVEEQAILEAKCTKGASAPTGKKMEAMTKTIKALKAKGINIVKRKGKKGKK